MLDHEPYKIINVLYYRFFKKDETEKYELEVAIEFFEIEVVLGTAPPREPGKS